MRRIDAADALIGLGIVLLAVGLWFYDWRTALIVCGVIILIVGLVGALRA